MHASPSARIFFSLWWFVPFSKSSPHCVCEPLNPGIQCMTLLQFYPLGIWWRVVFPWSLLVPVAVTGLVSLSPCPCGCDRAGVTVSLSLWLWPGWCHCLLVPVAVTGLVSLSPCPCGCDRAGVTVSLSLWLWPGWCHCLLVPVAVTGLVSLSPCPCSCDWAGVTVSASVLLTYRVKTVAHVTAFHLVLFTATGMPFLLALTASIWQHFVWSQVPAGDSKLFTFQCPFLSCWTCAILLDIVLDCGHCLYTAAL